MTYKDTERNHVYSNFRRFTQDEKVLLGMKNKSLNKMYKGLTESVVKEAFGWNDSFMINEPEQN